MAVSDKATLACAEIERRHRDVVKEYALFIRVGFETTVSCPYATPMLLALRLDPTDGRKKIGSDTVQMMSGGHIEEYVDTFGNLFGRVTMPVGQTTLWSDCIVEDSGNFDVFDWNAEQHEVQDLPVETLQFLLPSRYCESDRLVERAWALFQNTPPGWARAQAISNWVHNNVLFGYPFGRPSKTAVDVFREGTGVCRDFAHLFITFCRAMNLPARYVSGYLSDIGFNPDGAGDFCAWAEVYLGGRWYAFDARHNTPRIGRIPMVRGRDAADVAMITAFGNYALTSLKVWTEPVAENIPVSGFDALLSARPDVEAMVLNVIPDRNIRDRFIP